MASLHQIIGKVNPNLYAENKAELLKKYQTSDKIPADEVKPKPLSQHKLVYDSSTETLEPVYFFLLDLMNDMRLSPEKIFDNFSSSPGSGHFGELGQRATIMQQNASRIMGDINNVMRSILNLVYDLKEFKMRIENYLNLKSPKKEVREAALLALKQIWMDRVDINKGNSSIKAMAIGGGFQTLIDAFLFAQDESLRGPNGQEMDLNDQVKRIVKQRIYEFKLWLSESEKELAKRYEIERKYLKSQVNSVKLYSRWAKPYIRAAQQLEMKDYSRNPALVTTFNTLLLELVLLGKSKLDIKGAVEEGKLPKDFLKLQAKGDLKRDYNSCIVVEFNFRGIPQRTSQYQSNYVFGGKVEMTFSSYSLNSDELKLVNQELEKSDVEDALKLMESATTGSLEELQKDIDEFLKEEDKAEKEKIKPEDNSNPFLALFGYYNKPSPKEKQNEEMKIAKPDNYLEKTYLREITTNSAKETTFSLFDIYKKAHGMPSYP